MPLRDPEKGTNSIFVPLVGLVFPAIAMASLFIHVQKNKIF